MRIPTSFHRRDFMRRVVRGVVGLGTGASFSAAGRAAPSVEKTTQQGRPAFRLRYLLASCLYGYTDLKEILPEVSKTGAQAIDLWPKVHGNQREQLDALGEDRFRTLLEEYRLSLGCLTRYDLGPFGLKEEMRLAKRLGCGLIVTGASGPQGLTGQPLRGAVREFVEKMKPHLELAEECSVTIAIENHQNSLLQSPDSMRWLIELCSNKHLAIAFAPYHLPQNPQVLADLIRAVGRRIAVFYAWQHGKGSTKRMPLEDELLQLPGRGPLDFRPLLAALREVDYPGYTSIFMHPFPRGRAIRETTPGVTSEIQQARQYLETCLRNLS